MISKEIVYLDDFLNEADARLPHYGKTPRHSTGITAIDTYLGGGYGKPNGYEIVAIYGKPGVGKSMFGLRLLAHEIKQGTRIAAMILEDDIPDVLNNLRHMMAANTFEAFIRARNVELLPSSATKELWVLDDVLEWIEHKATTQKAEIFYIDHVQFLYENEEGSNRDAYARHRVFNKNLNNLMKRLKATVILISHVSKNSTAIGIDKMIGSSALGGAATKAIEVFRDDQGRQCIQVTKTRFTPKPNAPLVVDIHSPNKEVRDAIRSLF